MNQCGEQILRCGRLLAHHSFLSGALKKMWVSIKGATEVELAAYEGDGTAHFELKANIGKLTCSLSHCDL